MHSKNNEEELAPGRTLVYSSIIHLFINHSSPTPIIHLLIYSFNLFVPLPCFGCHRCWSSPALICPVSVAAAQQRVSDVTLSVTRLRGWPSQRSLRQVKEQHRAVPCLEGSFHFRLWPSGPWVSGKGGEGLLGQVRNNGSRPASQLLKNCFSRPLGRQGL